MMELFDHVKIKSTGISGVIVDISGENLVVESDDERKQGDDSGYPGRWALYTCSVDDVEPITH